MTTNTEAPQQAKSFEWWMMANFAMGAGYSAFVSLLIPPFVKEISGDASAAGVVMAVIALGALLGPALGSFADKYSAHRLLMVLGVAFMALAFVMLALSSDESTLFAIDAIVMGIGVAAVSAVGPVFISLLSRIVSGDASPELLEQIRDTVAEFDGEEGA